MRIPLLLAFFASFAAAQMPEAPKTIHVEGTVTSLTGEAVPRVTVRLQPSGGAAVTGGAQRPSARSETTDDTGKFVFDNVAAGRYSLMAEKAGFLTQRYGARSTTSPGTILVFTEGETRSNLAIKMTPQGIISGRVLDHDGDSMTGVQVQVLHYVYRNGNRTLTAVAAGTTTNDKGDYRIANLAPGRYYLSAADRRQALRSAASGRTTSGATQSNVTTFYPNGLDAADAAPVDVTPGFELRGMDFRMRREKVYSVRGRVVDTSGPLPPRFELRFGPKGTSPGAVTVNLIMRGEGSFEFGNVLPGTYVLQIQLEAGNGNPGTPAGRMEIAIANSNVENIVLPVSLSSSSDINGTIRYEPGDPKAASPSTPQSRAPGLLAALSTAMIVLSPIKGEGTFTASAKEDGTFRVPAVPPGKYSLTLVRIPGGGYAKSVHFGAQDVTHSPIDNSLGTGGMLDIVLASKSADASGTVYDDQGKPIASSIVVLWPRTREYSILSGGIQAGVTDQNGDFRIANIPPGDYYAASFEELESGLETYVEFLNHFTADAASLKLDESGHGKADLKRIPFQRIAEEIAKLP